MHVLTYTDCDCSTIALCPNHGGKNEAHGFCVCVGVCVWCVCVCVCSVCGCGVCVCGVCVCVFFFINIYLQHVPLHSNTTCSSVHVIHCLSFWSVFGTTCGDLFRTMTNYCSV